MLPKFLYEDKSHVWHSLFYSFFTEISNNYAKQQTSTQLISSAASQNELKADNKHKLLFNSFFNKQQLRQTGRKSFEIK
jgi:hypothetical protein